MRGRSDGLPYWIVAHWRGAPIRAHLSIPVSAGVLIAFSGGRAAMVQPLALLIIILVHELGHALIACRLGLEVEAIDLHGTGGECRVSEPPTQGAAIALAWGGVAGQMALFWVPDLLGLLGLEPQHFVWRSFLAVFIGPNLLLMLINLLPIAPLDGATAWKVFPWLWRRLRARKTSQKPRLRLHR